MISKSVIAVTGKAHKSWSTALKHSFWKFDELNVLLIKEKDFALCILEKLKRKLKMTVQNTARMSMKNDDKETKMVEQHFCACSRTGTCDMFAWLRLQRKCEVLSKLFLSEKNFCTIALEN